MGQMDIVGIDFRRHFIQRQLRVPLSAEQVGSLRLILTDVTAMPPASYKQLAPRPTIYSSPRWLAEQATPPHTQIGQPGCRCK